MLLGILAVDPVGFTPTPNPVGALSRSLLIGAEMRSKARKVGVHTFVEGFALVLHFLAPDLRERVTCRHLDSAIRPALARTTTKGLNRYDSSITTAR
jgi:hypothetical protein